MLRALRSTTGLYVSLGFSLLAAAQDAPRERVRFLDGKVELCEVGLSDAEGVLLKLEGLPRAVKFKWWQLAPEDAGRLRGVKGASEAPPGGVGLAVPGVRVRTTDGRVVEGVREAGAPEGALWLRTTDGRFVLGAAEAASMEEIQIPVVRAYPPDEAVSMLVSRLRPRTPEDYDRLGAELARGGLRERAEAAFKTAEALRRPDRPESRMAAVLIGLRERVEDLAVRKSIHAAEERALSGDYEAALLEVEALENSLAASPAALEELARVRSELQGLRGRARETRILDEAWRQIDALCKVKALDRTLALPAAKAWALERLPSEFLEQVRVRFNFSPDDAALQALWNARPEGPLFKHAYESAGWAVARPELGDAEAWWTEADDAERYALIKGIFVERHLQVRRVEEKSCAVCGGTGQVEVPPASPAVCGGCRGLKGSRVLIYR